MSFYSPTRIWLFQYHNSYTVRWANVCIKRRTLWRWWTSKRCKYEQSDYRSPLLTLVWKGCLKTCYILESFFYVIIFFQWDHYYCGIIFAEGSFLQCMGPILQWNYFCSRIIFAVHEIIFAVGSFLQWDYFCNGIILQWHHFCNGNIFAVHGFIFAVGLYLQWDLFAIGSFSQWGHFWRWTTHFMCTEPIFVAVISFTIGER